MTISHQLLQSASLDPWALSFKNKRLEFLYLRYALPNLSRQARIALLVGAMMYGLYGVIDSLLIPAEAMGPVWFILALVIITALAVFALTFHKRFARINQFTLASTGFLGGLGLLGKMWLLPDISISYFYAGLILIIFWCHCFSGLRFIHATWVSLSLLLLFNCMFLWLRQLPLLAMACFDFFIVSANIVGAFASHTSETQSRALFLREQELDRERHLQQERALHDRLTGLPNRELLIDRIEQAINYSERNDQLCAGFFLDLDNFKPINDTYGHAVGDLVLQEVAVRLKRITRETDTLSRLGGDEFFLLARDIKSEEDAKSLANKLAEQLNTPFGLQDLPFITKISVSIGICLLPYRDATAVDVIRRADQAMYIAKQNNKAS
ncbi:MAG TPA: GGDEF domain-containing protein [Methylophilaceae bacterium]|jgi:diguanylate cyclase (GGDEF)-like protein